MDEGALGFLMTAAPVVLCLGGMFLVLIGIFAWLLLKGSKQYRNLIDNLRKAKAISIAQLGTSSGLVRIEGVIQQVAASFGVLNTAPLAMLRMQISGIKEGDRGSQRGPIEGKEKTSPFLIRDDTGAVWVDPHPLDHRVMGKSRAVNEQEVEEACTLLGIDLEGLQRWSAPDTFEVWTWEEGQRICVVGSVLSRQDGSLTLGRIGNHPMIVSSIVGEYLAAEVGKDASRSRKVSIGLIILLGALVLFVICCIGMTTFQLLK